MLFRAFSILALGWVFFASMVSGQASDRIAILRDPLISGLDLSRVDALVADLQHAGYTVDALDSIELASVGAFSRTLYRSLILTQAPLFPMAAQANVLSFARAGGNLILLGGLLPDLDDGDNRNREGSNLLFIDDYELYRFDGVGRITTSPHQPLLALTLNLFGSYSGESALVGATPNEIKLMPLLDAVAIDGRKQGLAASLAINYGGAYTGGYWVLFPIEAAYFYTEIDIGARLLEMLPHLHLSALIEAAQAENALSKADTLALTSPSPKVGFVTIGADGQSLEHDGEKLFITGTNYIQNQFASLKTIWTEHLDVNQLERDFANMAAHGINAIRLFETQNLPHDTIRELARRYGIYILYELRALNEFASTYDPIESRQAAIEDFVEIWKDEPMLLGYDLKNEPKIPHLMLLTYAGQSSALLAANPYTNPAFEGLFDKGWVDRNAANPPSWVYIPNWCLADEALTKNLLAGYRLWTDFCNEQGYTVGSSVTGFAPREQYGVLETLIDHTFDEGSATLNGIAVDGGSLQSGSMVWVTDTDTEITADGAIDAANRQSAYIDLGTAITTGNSDDLYALEIVMDNTMGVTLNHMICGGFWGASTPNVQLSHDGGGGTAWWLWRGKGRFEGNAGANFDSAEDRIVSTISTVGGYETITTVLDLREADGATQYGTMSIYHGNLSDGILLGTRPLSGDEAFKFLGLSTRFGNATDAATGDLQSLRLLRLTPTGQQLDVPAKWQLYVDLLNETLADWIDACTESIRSLDTNHLITIGHNKAIGMLPANASLDFINYHAYDGGATGTHQSALDNATVGDRYAAMFPQMPVTAGEFGYSNGLIQNGGVINPDDGGVAEAFFFLKLFNEGRAGAWKWQYADMHPALLRRQWDWLNYTATDSFRTNGRFGLFTYDGSDIAKPKPVAHFVRFLQRYRAAGGELGDLSVSTATYTPQIAYTFESDTALSIGNNVSTHPHCAFTSARAASVMIQWDNEKMELMATTDLTVAVSPSELAGWSGASLGVVQVDLREGEIVTIYALATTRGTPHAWLDYYHLVTDGDYEGADSIDFDGDGKIAAEEFVAGTNPTDSNSVLSVTNLTGSGDGKFVLSWRSEPGKSYLISSSDSLEEVGWRPVSAQIHATPPVNEAAVGVEGADPHFWRIEVQP